MNTLTFSSINYISMNAFSSLDASVFYLLQFDFIVISVVFHINYTLQMQAFT